MNGLYAGKQAQVQKILEEKQIDLWLLMGEKPWMYAIPPCGWYLTGT